MNLMNSYVDFIKNRRSIRHYLEKEVSLDLIDIILETARWAPSAHNSQPWRFFVIRKKGIKKRLIAEMAGRFYQDLINDGVKEESALERANFSIQRWSKSPLILLACIDMSKMKYYSDPPRKRAEEILASQSLAAALQNILLSASSFGLGACWFSAPLFCQDVIKRVVDLPNYYAPQALLTLGYPLEIPKPPPRLTVNEIRTII